MCSQALRLRAVRAQGVTVVARTLSDVSRRRFTPVVVTSDPSPRGPVRCGLYSPAFATISMQHDDVIDRTEVHGTAISSMGAFGTGPKSTNCTRGTRGFRRFEEYFSQGMPVGGSTMSALLAAYSQSIRRAPPLSKSRHAKTIFMMVDDLCHLN